MTIEIPNWIVWAVGIVFCGGLLAVIVVAIDIWWVGMIERDKQ